MWEVSLWFAENVSGFQGSQHGAEVQDVDGRGEQPGIHRRKIFLWIKTRWIWQKSDFLCVQCHFFPLDFLRGIFLLRWVSAVLLILYLHFYLKKLHIFPKCYKNLTMTSPRLSLASASAARTRRGTTSASFAPRNTGRSTSTSSSSSRWRGGWTSGEEGDR